MNDPARTEADARLPLTGVKLGALRSRVPRRPTLAVLLAALLLAASVPRFGAPLYTLEPAYTDHVRHEYSAWAFLQEGFDVFSTPLERWSVSAEHPHPLWVALPVIYPPGLLLFFLPFGAASNSGLIGDTTVHMLMVMVVGAAGVVASLQLHRTLRLTYEAPLAGVLTLFGAVLYVKWGFDGFIDPLTAGVALLGMYWSRRGLHGRGLVALVVALSLHFRLWYLWPVVLALAIRRRREIGRWHLAASAAIAGVSLAAFVLAVPSVGGLDDIPGIEPNYLALTGSEGLMTQKLVALTVGVALLAVVYLSERDLVPVASLALVLVLVFGVAQWQAWYPVLLTPALALVRGRWAQAALTVAFLQLTFFLGGFPDLLRTLHLIGAGIR